MKVCQKMMTLFGKKNLPTQAHLNNISQNGNLPQIEVKIRNIWNHDPDNGTNTPTCQHLTNPDFHHPWVARSVGFPRAVAGMSCANVQG